MIIFTGCVVKKCEKTHKKQEKWRSALSEIVLIQGIITSLATSFIISGEAAITIQSHSKFTCGTSYSNNSNILKVPLCTHWFEHRGQQPSIYGCDLGDVERLAPVTARFLHALPQACVAGTVTQRAGEVAAPAGRHCYRVHSLAARMDWRV